VFIDTFTPIDSMTMTCLIGSFSFDGIDYCIFVEDITTSGQSSILSPPLRVSSGTRLNISLSATGEPPADMIVSTFTIGVVFAGSNFSVPTLAIENQPAELVVYVNSSSFGVVPLSAFQASVLYLPVPELRSVCPDRILAQVPQSVVIQGSNFYASSSLMCVLNGSLFFPGVLNNPNTVVCDLIWEDATADQVLSLNVANDGTVDSIIVSQTPLLITVKGEKPGSSEGCRCPHGTADNDFNCLPCDDGFYQDETGKRTCKSCGFGRDTNGLIGSDSIDECVCAALFFPDTVSQECLRCSYRMSCPGNNVVVIDPGFWRASEYSSKVIPCSSTSCSSSAVC
jgi:hypothetical protein